MHIKRVLIKGFKSYASQLEFDEFDSGSNVIVGKNGAGKSNFIDAIRFVLASDKFQKLRSEEKQALLHRGAGGPTMLGYVEIVFDNSDKRLPLDSEEVTLRRNIGLKADDYYLNGKRVPTEDVLNLLESAGFSRSNPYYIVLQGQVAQLTKMTPAERLDLLKEVAGTRVYDERRTESIQIMKETYGKKQKIEEVLEMLNERLTELESEMQELTEYRALDQERRALEYTIYHHQLQDCHNKLSELDQERLNDSERVAHTYTNLDSAHAKVKKAEADLVEVTNSLVQMERKKEDLLQEQRTLMASKAKLELELQDRESSMETSSSSKRVVATQLKAVQKEIRTASDKLKALTKAFETAATEERRLSEELATADGRMKDLLARAGRSGQFRTVKERDAWIKKEIADIKAQIQQKEKQAKELNARIKELEEKRDADRRLVESRSDGLAERKQRLEDAVASYQTLKTQRDEFNTKRKELWREEADSTQTIEKYVELLRKAERRVQSTMSKELAGGLAALERLKGEGQAPGVYGPVIDLFSCEDRFMTAVEVAAGNQLFYVVVDTDQTAADMVKYLNDEKAGRVTFIPLNRLEVREPPRINSTTSVKPLVDVLEYSTTYEKAFQQLFGKVLLCKTVDVATNVARMHKLTCITLDGDEVNSRGALTGGFYDPVRSRLAAYKDVREMREKIAVEKVRRDELRERIAGLDARITRAVAEVSDADSERVRLREDLDHFDQTARLAAKQQLSTEETLVQSRRAVSEINNAIQTLKDSQASLENELTTPLQGGLSDDERDELQQLSRDLPNTRKRLLELSLQRSTLEAQKAEVETQLSSHLLPRQDQLERAAASGELPDVDDAAQLRADFERVEAVLAKLTEEIDKVEQDMTKAKKRETQLRKEAEKLSTDEYDAEGKLQEESRVVERRLNKRALLMQKRDEAQKKLREVGSLPATAIETFEGKKPGECLSLLQSTNQKLKGFSNVNKKAKDQFDSFSDQRESLRERKAELDASEKAILELIETLDHHKDEAIERTVKGVSRFFTEIFERLTGGGKASLSKLVTEATEGRAREVKGIEVKVAFSQDKEQKMSQLSGGQASIVALSLIFAIQRCDPAPFYVFDEIDPALDDAHRRAVANMIQQAASADEEEEGAAPGQQRTQFIMTSHRPELVEVANKHYQIKFSNRVSSIESVDLETALEVVRSTGDEEDGSENVNGDASASVEPSED